MRQRLSRMALVVTAALLLGARTSGWVEDGAGDGVRDAIVGPVDCTLAFWRALSDKDVDRQYDMLCQGFRERAPREVWAPWIRRVQGEGPTEGCRIDRVLQVTALQPDLAVVEVAAEFWRADGAPFPTTRQLAVVKEADGWRVANYDGSAPMWAYQVPLTRDQAILVALTRAYWEAWMEQDAEALAAMGCCTADRTPVTTEQAEKWLATRRYKPVELLWLCVPRVPPRQTKLGPPEDAVVDFAFIMETKSGERMWHGGAVFAARDGDDWELVYPWALPGGGGFRQRTVAGEAPTRPGEGSAPPQ